jgi:hypothetical protein
MENKEDNLAMELLKELKVQNKRLVVALFTVIILWACTIGGFVWYLNQYDYSSYQLESNDGGNANFIGDDGDITNGERKSETENKEKDKDESQSNGNQEN